MASARELLAQADALMRRNRESVVDTEIPELTEMVAMMALAPAPTPAPAVARAPEVLDDVPELTEAVEEIEIESIVELPEDLDQLSNWLRYDHSALSVVGRERDSISAGIAQRTLSGAPSVEGARSPLAAVSKSVEGAMQRPNAGPAPEALAPKLASVEPGALASVVVTPQAHASPVGVSLPTGPEEWARWEALADEVRMQVLHRIDLFTDSRLRTELSEKLQPIVDRASAEMVSTINAHVGELLRTYVAEAIEGEIEKWRGPPR